MNISCWPVGRKWSRIQTFQDKKILFGFISRKYKMFSWIKGKDKILLGIEEAVSYVNFQDNSYTKQILIIMELKEKYNSNKNASYC